MRLRQITPVALVLALAVAGFIVARVLAEQDAERESEHRAEVAAAQIRGRVAQAASLTESLRRFMLNASGTGVTRDQFARNALRWLSPAGFPAAAWVEQIPASRRAAYERRIGQPIVTPDERRSVAPLRSRSSYVPATLVSGFPPMAVPGVDLGGEPGMPTALTRASRLNEVAATRVASPRAGASGLFLVAPAPNLVGEILRDGYVVVFVSDLTLRAAATDTPVVRIADAGTSAETGEGAKTASETFPAAGRRFDVIVPEESVHGASEVLPWMVLAAGLVLAALAGALGVNAARRSRTQAELDRIFKLSPDVIAVADFDGRFTRVNPAVEEVLGYTQEEFLATPYLDLVRPEDRERTAAEAQEIAQGKRTRSFLNNYRHKDGSYRVLEWTSTPVVEDNAMYGVARDVTERLRAEREVERLADEQAALRRVATLVAQDVPASELFAAVTREVGALLGADFSGMARFEEGNVVTVATWAAVGEHPPVPARWEMMPGDPATTIAETRRPARWDDWTGVPGPIAAFIRELGVRSTVGTPIVVEGRLWGALAAHSKQRTALPADTEAHMAQFTDLVATAVANAEARAEVERLAEEQAALRRVATLVAEGAPATAVFDAVAAEMERLLGADGVTLSRYEPDEEVTVVAHRGTDRQRVPPGTRVSHRGENVTSVVRRSERAARMEHYEGTHGAIAELVRGLGVRASVGAPIVVEGRLWGVAIANWRGEELPPADTEERMAKFAELLDTAIANADSRDQLTASRARLVTEADEARRRVVRDLHDGAQQRLVHTIVTLKLSLRKLRQNEGEAESVVSEALGHAEQANAELRKLAHGILPAVLMHGGLRAGVDSVVSRLDLPVEVDVPAERLPAEIEASAYFIVVEALTNVVKHANAGSAEVRASTDDGMLQVEIRDDGIGGADPDGHGLVGMRDRVTALGGRLEIESLAGGGTMVAARLPLAQ